MSTGAHVDRIEEPKAYFVTLLGNLSRGKLGSDKMSVGRSELAATRAGKRGSQEARYFEEAIERTRINSLAVIQKVLKALHSGRRTILYLRSFNFHRIETFLQWSKDPSSPWHTRFDWLLTLSSREPKVQSWVARELADYYSFAIENKNASIAKFEVERLYRRLENVPNKLDVERDFIGELDKIVLPDSDWLSFVHAGMQAADKIVFAIDSLGDGVAREMREILNARIENRTLVVLSSVSDEVEVAGENNIKAAAQLVRFPYVIRATHLLDANPPKTADETIKQWIHDNTRKTFVVIDSTPTDQSREEEPKLSPKQRAAYDHLNAAKTAEDWGNVLHRAHELSELASDNGWLRIIANDAMAVAHQMRGALDEARRLWTESAELGSRDAWTYIGLGNLEPDSAQSLRWYMKATELEPNNVTAHYNVGVKLKQTRRLSEAQAAFERVLNLDENHVDANFHLGAVLLALGDARGAKEAYSRTIEIAPNYGDAYFNLGLAHARLGDLDKAEETLERALLIQPSDPDTIGLLKEIRRQRKKE